MGFITPDKKGDEEEPGPGRSLGLDLDPKACPVCRRELLPWQDQCPDHDAEAVPRSQLPAQGGPPIPDHLLDEDDADDADV